MASLGFRHPQFSEDSAWLPVWLQRHQRETPDECIEESETSISRAFKGGQNTEILKGNIGEAAIKDVLSSQEGRYNSCHLFLSGEDNSPTTLAPSTGNVLHFTLRLSSNSDSQYTQSEQFCASQVQIGFNKLQPMQKVDKPVGAGQQTNGTAVSLVHHIETSSAAKIMLNKEVQVKQAQASAGTEGRSYVLERDNKTSMVNLFPLTSQGKMQSHVIPSPTNEGNSVRLSEKNLDTKSLNSTDISDAVELSISASEALVIHESVNNGSASEGLATVSLLEAALQVKHARLEGLEYDFHSRTIGIDETDYLLDLDDLTMADSYNDVGLSFSGPEDRHPLSSDASLVKETPLSDIQFECTYESRAIDFESGHKKLPDPAVDLKSPRHDTMFPQSIKEIPQSIKEISHAIAMQQPEIRVNSVNAQDSDNAGNDNLGCLASDRFRSRWLFGWAAKEVDAPTELLQNNKKCISKFRINETSFLSESADIAPDENSFVQKDKTVQMVASQSSVPFEGLNNRGSGENLMSQDVSCSNISLVDPLCSVVPCSISSVNTNCPPAENQVCIDIIVDESPEVENLQKTSDLRTCGDQPNEPPVTKAGSKAPIQRQVKLLKNYSTLLPNYDANLMKTTICHNQSLPSVCNTEYISMQRNWGCIRSSDKRCFEEMEPLGTASKTKFAGRDTISSNDIITISQLEGTSYGEHEKDVAELQFQSFETSKSPIMLNRKRHHCLRTFKLVNDNFSGKEKSKETGQKEASLNLYQNFCFQNLQSDCDDPLRTQFPRKKQVRFSKGDIEIPQNKDIGKQQSRPPTRRATKRSNCSSTKLDSQLKSCFTTRVNQKRLIFDGIKFLLTGFSIQKDKEIERLIQQNGGLVLLEIPPPSWVKRGWKSNFQQLPIVLCPKKLKTTKFLYGCSVNAFILRVKWLTDSLAAGSILPPEKYLIIPNQADMTITRIGKPVQHGSRIFDRVGIMLHGKHSFCTKFTLLLKHGGGQVFKTLQWLVRCLDSEKISVGVIIAEDENRVSRHLRRCAYERGISVMSVSWLIKSLHLGKLLPFTESNHNPLPTAKAPEIPVSLEWSEEI